jgi:DNA-binding SARP family transcriptional activator
LPGGQPRALLALLLLNANDVVSADRVIDEIWGERPPDTARHALHGYVSRLRKALGPEVLTTKPGGYAAAVAPGELDADRFTQMLEHGRELAGADPRAGSALLHEALDLWRGPALADFTFEPFAQADIVRLEELRLVALEERVEADFTGVGHPLVELREGLAVVEIRKVDDLPGGAKVVGEGEAAVREPVHVVEEQHLGHRPAT